MYTIGRLAKRYNLSRSTLLYYDSIDLLKPVSHEKGEYRRYSETDAMKLDQICRYREYGLSLEEIKEILDADSGRINEVFQKRFNQLTEEIIRLRTQQKLIIGVIRNQSKLADIPVFDRESWTALLSMAGFTDDDMRRWHIELEKQSPTKHKNFMDFLGIPENHQKVIRSWLDDNKKV